MKTGERFWLIFDKTITIMMIVSAVLVLFDALAVTIDVLMRYAFSITNVFLFELTEFSLLWMTFLGAAYIMRNNGHVRVDALISLLSPRHGAIMNVIGSIISLFILMVMTFYTAKLTLHDFQTGFTLSGILRAIKWPIEIIIPIGFFLLFIQLLRNTYRQLTELKVLSRKEQTSSDSPMRGGL
jgi:TRAP-type C4-dicarboxylate transport system permease small subunit